MLLYKCEKKKQFLNGQSNLFPKYLCGRFSYIRGSIAIYPLVNAQSTTLELSIGRREASAHPSDPCHSFTSLKNFT